jgi:hypothetical protein
MWTHEITVDSLLAPEAIWAVLADMDNWPRWDTSMESVKLQGPFSVGTRVAMTPTGQDPITSVIAEIRENEFYADETDMTDVTLRFSTALDRLPDGGTRLVHRLEISGPAADEIGPELGPAITADFPDAMRALLAYAAA